MDEGGRAIEAVRRVDMAANAVWAQVVRPHAWMAWMPAVEAVAAAEDRDVAAGDDIVLLTRIRERRWSHHWSCTRVVDAGVEGGRLEFELVAEGAPGRPGATSVDAWRQWWIIRPAEVTGTCELTMRWSWRQRRGLRARLVRRWLESSLVGALEDQLAAAAAWLDAGAPGVPLSADLARTGTVTGAGLSDEAA